MTARLECYKTPCSPTGLNPFIAPEKQKKLYITMPPGPKSLEYKKLRDLVKENTTEDSRNHAIIFKNRLNDILVELPNAAHSGCFPQKAVSTNLADQENPKKTGGSPYALKNPRRNQKPERSKYVWRATNTTKKEITFIAPPTNKQTIEVQTPQKNDSPTNSTTPRLTSSVRTKRAEARNRLEQLIGDRGKAKKLHDNQPTLKIITDNVETSQLTLAQSGTEPQVRVERDLDEETRTVFISHTSENVSSINQTLDAEQVDIDSVQDNCLLFRFGKCTEPEACRRNHTPPPTETFEQHQDGFFPLVSVNAPVCSEYLKLNCFNARCLMRHVRQ
ncbi:unnamed protein product [Caenorhabditis auriculariae]|uniref:C3H1-type domain-containing protein n=1 Tax=Caenorhabditis auriculariae TaxID=2777116 RepID=A0A8S1H6C0_9PELO|nr:unnamed protein product [Caenorhabditis auriculariae]